VDEGRRQGVSRKGGSAPRPRREYPVARPIAPPPLVFPHPAEAPPPARRSFSNGRSPFQRDFRIAASIIGVAAMVLGCVWVGWSLTHGQRPVAAKQREQAKAAPAEPPRSNPPREAPTELPRSEARPEAGRLPFRPPSPPVPAPSLAVVAFDSHVLPIFEKKCISCHGGLKKRGGLDLRTEAALRRGGDSGPAIQPGAPEASPLWESIASGRMPPGRNNKLSDADKRTIRDWLASAARRP
jgi:mono/diheme cytochrome c family protein